MISTLNYDMLLEEAATSLGVSIRKILKLHGSPNYIPEAMQFISGLTIWPMPAEPTTSIGGSGTGAHTRGPVDVVDRKTAIARLSTADAVAPAISAFAVGKKVYDSPDFVLNLQSIFRKAVDEVGSVVIAGVELNQADEHIWEPLAKTKARIGVINPNYAPYQQWSAMTGQTRVSQLFKRVQDIFHSPSVTRKFLDYL